MVFQVFDPRGFNTQTDYSGLTQGIGQLIQGQIANHFAKKAEEGDAGSMARLSSIDPRRAATLGSILDTRRQEQMYAEQQAAKQQAQQEEQKRALMGRIARGYTTAKDKVGYLSAAAANMDRAGFSDVADMIMVDLSKYKEAPGEVDQQYQAVQAMFGDGGGENPAQVQYMQYLTQGFSPEQELQARQAAAGIAAKETTQRPIIIGGVPHVFDPNTGSYAPAKIDNRQITADDVADDAAIIQGAKSGASEQAKLDAQAKMRPQIEANIQAAKDTIRIANEIKGDQRSNDRAFDVYNTGMGHLVAAMGGTNTGPISGRLPAITAEAQIAEGAVSAMAPVLKAMFRSAGEGTFTDRDQALLIEMLPTRKDHPEAIKAKMAGIDAIVSAKLRAVSQPATPAKRMRFNPATGRLE